MTTKATIGLLPREDAVKALKEAATLVCLDIAKSYEDLDDNTIVTFRDMPGPFRNNKCTLASLFGDTPAYAIISWILQSIPGDKFLQTDNFPAWFEKYYVERGSVVGGIRVTRLDIMHERRIITKIREEIQNKEYEIHEREAKIQQLLENLSVRA